MNTLSDRELNAQYNIGTPAGMMFVHQVHGVNYLSFVDGMRDRQKALVINGYHDAQAWLRVLQRMTNHDLVLHEVKP